MAGPTLQTLMLKAVLAMPRPILRGLAGGGVVYVGGRTLDPRMQYLASQARGAPPLSNFTPQEARAGTSMMLAPFAGELEPGTKIENLTVPGQAGAIPVRVYRPARQDPASP